MANIILPYPMTTDATEALQRLVREISESLTNYQTLPDIFPEDMAIRINFRTMTVETEYK